MAFASTSAGASKTWITRRVVNGKMQVRTLGKYPALRVAKARVLTLQLALDRNASERMMESVAKEYYNEVVPIEHRRPEFFRGYLNRAILPELGPHRVVDLPPIDVAAVIRNYKARG
jgi:hypothetical protein